MGLIFVDLLRKLALQRINNLSHRAMLQGTPQMSAAELLTVKHEF